MKIVIKRLSLNAQKPDAKVQVYGRFTRKVARQSFCKIVRVKVNRTEIGLVASVYFGGEAAASEFIRKRTMKHWTTVAAQKDTKPLYADFICDETAHPTLSLSAILCNALDAARRTKEKQTCYWHLQMREKLHKGTKPLVTVAFFYHSYLQEDVGLLTLD